MSKLDDKIREALSAEDAELFGEVGSEPSLPMLVLESFSGKHRWLNRAAVLVGVAMMAALVYCTVQFFGTPEVGERLAWALGVGFFTLMVLGIKIWHWMELERLAVTREIKRVELQIARLSQRMEERRPPE
ncbi:MAG: hypothetical protein RIB60_10300 [Phycisphaerales bacterium]